MSGPGQPMPDFTPEPLGTYLLKLLAFFAVGVLMSACVALVAVTLTS